MPRGHESTWPYTGQYTPAPPPRSRGAPIVPGAGSTPPPLRERPPSGALAQLLGSLRVPPQARLALLRPPSPAAAKRFTRSPPRRPTATRDPGPGAPEPSPARPPDIHPAGPVPVRFGREGMAWRFPPPPPGLAPVDDARRDSSPPSGVRAPPLTVAPSAAGAPGNPADFGQPRPPLFPGQPNSGARGLAHRNPSPSRARPPTGPQPPPPPPRVHTRPLPPSTPPLLLHRLPSPPRWASAAADGRTPVQRGDPRNAVGVHALPPLPPAACIMALHESYLPPCAPCKMAASGLCPFPPPMPHAQRANGGGQRPLGGTPRTLGGAPRTPVLLRRRGGWCDQPASGHS